MMTRSRLIAAVAGLFLLVNAPAAFAQETEKPEKPEPAKKADSPEKAAPTTPPKKEPAKPAVTTATPAKPKTIPHALLLKDAKPIPGLIPLYRKETKLYAELSGSNYGSEYIVLIAIARGIGRGPILGGMTLGMGDDWVWTFRKVDKRVHIVRRNVRFRATAGKPEASAVKKAYTDSVLFSLPIITTGPKGGDLVDLSPVFMSDLPQLSSYLPGFSFSSTKSTYASIKGFKDNVEIQVAATYASSGRVSIESVADSRGATINIHYSISKLPKTGYQPRQADPRVGYFLTVVKDYSKKTSRDQFVRYVNRWDLQKADAAAKLSPPKKPVIFWIEKTAPYKYRKPIREGIEEWNKAFEKAGFVNAIEVRQQPADAEWDPEDINYNTFRWITSSAGFAMGPSRVNPYSGQILDADILFDADFLHYWKEEFDSLAPGGADPVAGPFAGTPAAPFANGHRRHHRLHEGCRLAEGMAQQLAFGNAALVAKLDPKKAAELKEKMIFQGLKEVTMHEVGHTLGLRHNFQASTFYTLTELNDKAKTASTGLAASVMDYLPTNIVPKGQKQGDYFSMTIGPYDLWAIEYGYKPLSGGTNGETAELKKIAARSGEPALAYATDEDCSGFDPDPLVNRFDLGKDLIGYAAMQAALVKSLIPGLVDRMTPEGEDYVQARRTFNVLLATQGQSMSFVARYVGGLYASRTHKGQKDARPPFVVVEPKKQRDALALLEKEVFGPQAYQFPAEMYNYLGPSRWTHWGARTTSRSDYPIHDVVAVWQSRVLYQLTSSTTLERIADNELKVPADKDALTVAELLARLTRSIFSEIDTIKGGQFTNRKPAINSLRRQLQRNYFQRLADLATARTIAPNDCQALAAAELGSLETRINAFLKGKAKLDDYTRAHLQEAAVRIRKALEARATLMRP